MNIYERNTFWMLWWNMSQQVEQSLRNVERARSFFSLSFCDQIIKIEEHTEKMSRLFRLQLTHIGFVWLFSLRHGEKISLFFVPERRAETRCHDEWKSLACGRPTCARERDFVWALIAAWCIKVLSHRLHTADYSLKNILHAALKVQWYRISATKKNNSSNKEKMRQIAFAQSDIQ